MLCAAKTKSSMISARRPLLVGPCELRAVVPRKARKRYDYVRSLLPTLLQPMIKDEIVSMIFMALKRRTYKKFKGHRTGFGISHVKLHIKDFIQDYYKLYPAKAYGGIETPWSLDAPVSHENDTRLIDTVSEGLWA